VQLLGDRPGPALEAFRTYFDLPLEKVDFVHSTPGAVRRRMREADLAVIQSNFRSYGLPARRTAYVLQVPYGPITPWTLAAQAASGSVRRALKDMLRTQLFRTARRSSLVLANSAFSAAALRRHHGIDARVLYPPIDTFEPARVKLPIILSVGRFFTGAYNDKRYDVLLGAFRRLVSLPAFPPSWEYHCAGSCGTDAASRRFLDGLQEAAAGLPVHFHVNASYDDLRRLYAGASLFWHAAGFGVDEDLHPELTEHFGMSTVEAMSAGCVPIVVARGGQREIVSHGESGYLWNTVDELVLLTRSLLSSPEERTRIAAAARERSRDFSRKQFAERCLTLLEFPESPTHG
jgi:glycosyltransferase involved in cell wall biosynthesis